MLRKLSLVAVAAASLGAAALAPTSASAWGGHGWHGGWHGGWGGPRIFVGGPAYYGGYGYYGGGGYGYGTSSGYFEDISEKKKKASPTMP